MHAHKQEVALQQHGVHFTAHLHHRGALHSTHRERRGAQAAGLKGTSCTHPACSAKLWNLRIDTALWITNDAEIVILIKQILGI